MARVLKFWYPTKRLAMELCFLVSLIGAFYYGNLMSMHQHRAVPILMFSHLLFLALTAVLFQLGELVYDVIAKRSCSNSLVFSPRFGSSRCGMI